MCFDVFICDSLGYKVHKLVIVIYIGGVSSFVEFEGQTSKNIHDVRNVCL